jgi:hypothetical protein
MGALKCLAFYRNLPIYQIYSCKVDIFMGVTANIFTVFMVVKLQDPNFTAVELVTIGKAFKEWQMLVESCKNK